MKIRMVFLVLLFLLAGCAAQPVFEQVQDVYSGSVSAPAEILVSLPEEASVLTSGADNRERLYFCDGYTLTVQTLSGGDLDRTMREVTGYDKDALTILETQRNGLRCISCAWTCLGEEGDQVGRMVLLDDGDYHYAVSVMAPAEDAGNLAPVWESILNNITLLCTDS